MYYIQYIDDLRLYKRLLYVESAMRDTSRMLFNTLTMINDILFE